MTRKRKNNHTDAQAAMQAGTVECNYLIEPNQKREFYVDVVLEHEFCIMPLFLYIHTTISLIRSTSSS